MDSENDNEKAMSEYDKEEQNILYFNDLFSFNIIRPVDLKSEKDNNDNDIDIIQSSEGNKITHWSNMLTDTSRDKIDKIFDEESFVLELKESHMALPPRDQRHQYLRYEGLQYIDADIADFETRLARIYKREIHRENRDAQEQSMFTSRAWRRLFDIRGPLVHELILEFFSNFRFGKAVLDLDTPGALQFWLGGVRLIACSVAGRSQAPEKVTVTDLFYLRGMDVGSVNVPYLLARYLRLFASGRKQGAMISGGQYVARLAEHFGLLTEERLQGLTAWVPTRPARQKEGARGVAEEAPIAPGGGDEDEEMPQAGQREVLDSMARDFSRFSTWTITSLARMMDMAGVPYTRYSESPVEYESITYGASDVDLERKEIDEVGEVSII
ncbi:hypothetical protein Tco_1154448 [Tanacetum coccineum]